MSKNQERMAVAAFKSTSRRATTSTATPQHLLATQLRPQHSHLARLGRQTRRRRLGQQRAPELHKHPAKLLPNPRPQTHSPRHSPEQQPRPREKVHLRPPRIPPNSREGPRRPQRSPHLPLRQRDLARLLAPPPRTLQLAVRRRSRHHGVLEQQPHQ